MKEKHAYSSDKSVGKNCIFMMFLYCKKVIVLE